MLGPPGNTAKKHVGSANHGNWAHQIRVRRTGGVKAVRASTLGLERLTEICGIAIALAKLSAHAYAVVTTYRSKYPHLVASRQAVQRRRTLGRRYRSRRGLSGGGWLGRSVARRYYWEWGFANFPKPLHLRWVACERACHF